MRCYLVWGDIRDPQARLAYRADLEIQDVPVHAVGGHPYAVVRVGPVEVSGPVVALDGDVDAPVSVVVLAGSDIPDWVARQQPLQWGWEAAEDVPPAQRLPFPVDVLLLCPAAEGRTRLEGWSATLWFDTGMLPLQRVSVDAGGVDLDVRVLECGALGTGAGHLVVFCPDREAVVGARLGLRGWWQEAWVQVRGNDWLGLAALSDAVQSHVVSVLRSPVLSEVEVHDVLGIPGEALALLPEDVRGGLERALREMPDAD